MKIVKEEKKHGRCQFCRVSYEFKTKSNGQRDCLVCGACVEVGKPELTDTFESARKHPAWDAFLKGIYSFKKERRRGAVPHAKNWEYNFQRDWKIYRLGWEAGMLQEKDDD